MFQENERPTPKQFIKRMVENSEYSYEDILGPRRGKHIVCVRHSIIMAVKEEYPRLSFPQLGRLFNRDHTTILHAVENFESKMNPVENQITVFLEAKDFVMKKCAEFGISYMALCAKSTDAWNIERRTILLRETAIEFPMATKKTIAKLFNRQPAYIHKKLINLGLRRDY